MTEMLKFLNMAMPLFIDIIHMISTASDDEWETIASAWPTPTRIRAEYLRAEIKALKHFGLEKKDD
jgi:hypothetical protein